MIKLSNNHGIPPVNTKDNCKKLGIATSSVEVFGLQSIIKQMKKRPRRRSDMLIAEDINATILKDSEDKISHMAINRWWKKHRDDEDPTDDMVNIYGEYLSSLKSITRQIEVIEAFQGNLNDSVDDVEGIIKASKIITDLSTTFDKLTMRKSALLGTIGDIQAKVYSYVNFTTVLEFFEAKMKDKDEIWYHQCIAEISKDPMLAEVLRKIKDDTK